MRNLKLTLLVGCLAFMTVNASASDADVGKTKNSEIVEGSLISFDYAVCEYQVINPMNFESQTIELCDSAVNELAMLDHLSISGVDPAPMFKSPSSMNYVPAGFRRARDGLMCNSYIK